MPWYRVGQVAIAAGQNTVTGTGTAFSANARVGDALQGPDGRWYEVTNIASATALSILPAYQGATVAGGSYGLAPMQGYVKESADRLRQLVDQWGSTLAGLGSVSTENVVPVAKGGTGGTNPALARSGLGLKSAAIADIVGAVSQSGGAATGAIIERGSNANGEYVKFADGTMICTNRFAVTVAATANGSIFRDAAPTPSSWSYPAVFAAAPSVMYTSAHGSCWCATFSPATASAPLIIYASFAYSGSANFNAIAIGRWF